MPDTSCLEFEKMRNIYLFILILIAVLIEALIEEIPGIHGLYLQYAWYVLTSSQHQHAYVAPYTIELTRYPCWFSILS